VEVEFGQSQVSFTTMLIYFMRSTWSLPLDMHPSGGIMNAAKAQRLITATTARYSRTVARAPSRTVNLNFRGQG